MQGDKLLIIPIELFQREIYTGLYLGLSMVEKGYDILVCDQLNPILGNINGGVVFHKDHAAWSLDYIKSFKRRGAKVIVHDTEGLIIIDEQRYVNGRVSSEVIEAVDTVLCWGQTQRSLISRCIQTDKLQLAGDLRFDIARKRKTAEQPDENIKKVLFNTRFSYVNPIQKTDIIKTFKDLRYLKTEEDVIKFKQIVANDELIFREFVSAVNLLVKEGKDVIIRPHPAENIDTYIAMFEGRVKVDKETSLGTQIDWADCVVHDGCTTAIEARAQGKLVFGLRPELTGEAYDQYANQFSTFNCHSSLELAEKISSPNDFLGAISGERNNKIDEDIYNFFDKKPFFVDTVYEVLREKNNPGYKIGRGINRIYLRELVKQTLYFLIKKLRLKFLYNSTLVDGMEKYEIKFGKLSLSQIQEFCYEIETSIIKRKCNYQIKQLNSKAFILKGNKELI